MPGLPKELPWRRFACVLRKLGYTAEKPKAGAGSGLHKWQQAKHH